MSWDPWELADTGNVEEATENIKLDLKMLARYARIASALIVPFRKIGAALETKEIVAYADRIEIRLQDMAEMSDLLRQAPPLFDEFAQEVEELCEGIAEGATHGHIESAPEALRSYEALLGLGKRLLKYEVQVGAEDEDQHINWTLEDYLGEGATIYQRLQKVTPPTLIEDGDYFGTRTIYGVLKYYDSEYVEMRVNEIREELEEEG